MKLDLECCSTNVQNREKRRWEQQIRWWWWW